MLSWASDAGGHLETTRVVLTERGMRVNGYIIDAAGDDQYGASYSLLVDTTGRTRRITVQSDSREGERHLALTRTPGGPWVVESTSGSNPLYALDPALDVDLQSSAFTNALSIRRLVLAHGPAGYPPLHEDNWVAVACIDMPSLAVRMVHHCYTFRGDGVVFHRGPSGEVDLSVDDRHFVRSFPGLSHRLG